MVNNCLYYQIVNAKAFTKDLMFLIQLKVLWLVNVKHLIDGRLLRKPSKSLVLKLRKLASSPFNSARAQPVHAS